jgi:SAM-dependent methyltransferase
MAVSLKEKASISNQYAKDRSDTLRNRAKLGANRNLLFWYQKLYQDQFRNLGNIEAVTILEIGSGTSPLGQFYPSIITSDVLDLDYLDYVFDCHQIDHFEPIVDNSLDVITLTNTLHHLRRPIEFLCRAARKMKSGGRIIATEPYFSLTSTLIYKYLHHEPVDFLIDNPELTEVHGPLSSANSPLPWLIFQRPEWRTKLEQHFTFERPLFRPFTGLSYFATGGISRRIPIPRVIYRAFFYFDLWFSRLFPRLWASFFTITLIRK